jgi:signal transduction histidine kinase/ActR/RegA family two-component response regulator
MRIKTLVLFDSKNEFDLLVNHLSDESGRVFFYHVPSLEKLAFELNKKWDLIISDYSFSQKKAQDIFKMIQRSHPEVPFVLVSDGVGEEVTADLMKAGVEDVVIKSKLDRLTTVFRRINREHTTKTQELKAHKMVNQALASREQMLAIVSHDIKNPISAIQLEAQMLLRASDRSSESVLKNEVKTQANRILKTTERMKALISDLLDKSKSLNGLSDLHRDRLNVLKLLHDVLDGVKPLIEQKNIFLFISVPEDCTIYVDRNKMFQVFSNLINNSIKFTPDGGMIQVSLDERELCFIFAVEDNGSGINENDILNVFEKYWTGVPGDSSGTGLGLFICKTIIEAHGGKINVENIPHGGAKFYFTIPKESYDKKDQDIDFYNDLTDHRKMIYVIDDDEDLREVISWALTKEGYSVHPFSSPKKALNALNRMNRLPSLIILDFHMDEINGDEFVSEKQNIKNADQCPIIMMSASPKDIEDSISLGSIQQVITKPIDLEGLLNAVKTFVNH